jgi:glycosyltransferase involved in cell wall biosynthesis
VEYVKLHNLYWPYGQRHSAPLRLAWNLLDINNPWMGREVERRLRALRPDIVHTNNLQALSGAVWVTAKRMDIPIVHTLRDLYLLCPRSTMFRHERNCEKLCRSCSLFANAKRPSSFLVDHVVGISRFILDKHLKFGWFPQASSSVIFNSYAPPREIKNHVRSERITFGFIGRVDRRKGIEWLLSSFADPRVATSATLIVAGDGEPEYVELLKSRVKHLEIKFVGRLTPEEFFAQIDVAVVPSIIDEALGRVILEAYAYGKPVIASNRGGIPEIVSNGRTGFLVDPDAPDQLTERLAGFIREPDLFAKLEPACQARFADFTPERIADQYLSVYKSVLDGGRSPKSRLVSLGILTGSSYEA